MRVKPYREHEGARGRGAGTVLPAAGLAEAERHMEGGGRVPGWKYKLNTSRGEKEPAESSKCDMQVSHAGVPSCRPRTLCPLSTTRCVPGGSQHGLYAGAPGDKQPSSPALLGKYWQGWSPGSLPSEGGRHQKKR